MRDFEGKVAVVTGAASGMGRAFAERFAQEGMKVVLADVESAPLERAVLQLRQGEHDVIGIVTDVASPESVDALARQAIDVYGKVHIVCNNAGVAGERGLIWEETPQFWQWMMGVNFHGVLNGIRTFTPLMLEHGEDGHIVNTASIAGLGPGWGVYGVTKHAVIAMTEWLSMNLQMVDAKIDASVLCPGGVATNITTLYRSRPDDLQDDPSRVAPSVEAARLQRYRERMSVAVAAGKAPEEIADILVEGIRNNDFYILTHPEQEEARIQSRADLMKSRRAPQPPTLITADDWNPGIIG
jgi:NAD(P)-dependent dehydrogenase (short-subunit alcohol dehydrogenase family)